MTTTPEGKVKDKIKALLKAYGAYYAMPIGSAYGKQGVPDFLACCHGQFIGIEAKADATKQPTKLQQRNLQCIKDSWGIALVIHDGNLEQLEETLKWCIQKIV